MSHQLMVLENMVPIPRRAGSCLALALSILYPAYPSFHLCVLSSQAIILTPYLSEKLKMSCQEFTSNNIGYLTITTVIQFAILLQNFDISFKENFWCGSLLFEMTLNGSTIALYPYHGHLPGFLEMKLKGGIVALYPYHGHLPGF